MTKCSYLAVLRQKSIFTWMIPEHADGAHTQKSEAPWHCLKNLVSVGGSEIRAIRQAISQQLRTMGVFINQATALKARPFLFVRLCGLEQVRHLASSDRLEVPQPNQDVRYWHFNKNISRSVFSSSSRVLLYIRKDVTEYRILCMQLHLCKVKCVTSALINQEDYYEQVFYNKTNFVFGNVFSTNGHNNS